MAKMCSRCVLDSEIIGIHFDEEGVCNFCRSLEAFERVFPMGKEGKRIIEQKVEQIKKDGKNKKYDCIMGISGGVDSTYVLYLLKAFGLKPLVFHLDNGWNSEISEKNMKNVVEKLGFELKTVKVNWGEFKDLQIAFLKASTPDSEVPTDIGLVATEYKLAEENDIKHIITGGNFRTEGKVPISWSYGCHYDGRYIKDVQKKFGTMKLKTFPIFTLWKRLKYRYIKRIEIFRPLNYMEYNKEEVKKFLIEELGWKDYGGKHYESVYTRFLQAYILPKKFNIDKRKVYYCALINSGQITRKKSLEELKEPTYPEDMLKSDKKHVCEKLELTEKEFDEIMDKEPKMFTDYNTYYPTIMKTRFIIKPFYKFVTGVTNAPPTIFDEMESFERDMHNKFNHQDR